MIWLLLLTLTSSDLLWVTEAPLQDTGPVSCGPTAGVGEEQGLSDLQEL